uniref:Natriuretic peptide DNP n=1 Tax=Dendroaspis angusticeps TaxID=8618 RepID=VNP_DENAN|nr:RecName: Full=Natriuretic peptide DNP [Dendroaspis angusticeps]AAB22476.1 natriuretic peptide, DNP [Dendroaspis angusticeps=green mamba, Peptide, 38 aa] [Dendroaspis angusticeps]7BRI_L Chain L, Natriuretic peptide DNP [Dendroaspis angusticeps]
EVKYDPCFGHKIDRINHVSNLGCPSLRDPRPNAPSTSA